MCYKLNLRKETKMRWKPVSGTPKTIGRLKKTKAVLTGITIYLITLYCLILSGCTRSEYIYQEIEREPITCIDSIKTPQDMLDCLTEYSVKY